MSSDHSAAISAAARALSPPPSQRSKSPKPSSKRPKPASRSSSTESNASTSSIAALQTHPSKNKTPLRAAETVYYDAQSGPSASETSSTAPVKTADSRQKAVTVTLSKPKMQPPVFIESSMSDWRTSEMAYEVDQSSGEGQYLFYKDFQDVIPGEHMYRFKTDVKRDGWSGWLVDESSPTVMDDRGREHNLIVVENKPHSIQVPHGSNMMFANTVAPGDGKQSGLLIKADKQEGAVSSDLLPAPNVAHLTATATDLLQSKAEDLPVPHADEAQFSELAVSPPANDTFHRQGILEAVIQSTIATAGGPDLSNSGIASPLIDLASPASTSPPSYPPIPPMNSPSKPLTKVATQAESLEDLEMNEEAKEILFEIVNARLGFTPQGFLIEEPAEAIAELGTIPEEPEPEEKNEVLGDATGEAEEDQPEVEKKPSKHWFSVTPMLLSGAVSGFLLGLLLLQLWEGSDLAPVMDGP